MTYHRTCNKSNTTGVTSWAGTVTVYPYGAAEFTPVNLRGSCAQSLLFCAVCF